MALVSDAGTPLVADPGYRLAAEAIAAGHAGDGGARRLGAARGAGGRRPADRPLPVRGLPAAPRPRRGAARWRSSRRCRRRSSSTKSPRRLAASLADMAAVLGEPAGGGLPRAHQALRGGPARHAGGARRGLRRRAASRRARSSSWSARRRPQAATAAELDAALARGAGRRARCRTRRPRSPRRSACRGGRSMPGRSSWPGARGVNHPGAEAVPGGGGMF